MRTRYCSCAHAQPGDERPQRTPHSVSRRQRRRETAARQRVPQRRARAWRGLKATKVVNSTKVVLGGEWGRMRNRSASRGRRAYCVTHQAPNLRTPHTALKATRTNVRVDLARVELRNQGLDRAHGAVALPVTADDELQPPPSGTSSVDETNSTAYAIKQPSRTNVQPTVVSESPQQCSTGNFSAPCVRWNS